MPVGFYYKTFVRPRFAWPIAERDWSVVRRAGRAPARVGGSDDLHADGCAGDRRRRGRARGRDGGRSERGDAVIVCDEGRLGRGSPRDPCSTGSASRRRSGAAVRDDPGRTHGARDLRGSARSPRGRRRRSCAWTRAGSSWRPAPSNHTKSSPATIFPASGGPRRGASRRRPPRSPGSRAVVAAHTDEGVDHMRALARCRGGGRRRRARRAGGRRSGHVATIIRGGRVTGADPARGTYARFGSAAAANGASSVTRSCSRWDSLLATDSFAWGRISPSPAPARSCCPGVRSRRRCRADVSRRRVQVGGGPPSSRAANARAGPA